MGNKKTSQNSPRAVVTIGQSGGYAHGSGYHNSKRGFGKLDPDIEERELVGLDNGMVTHEYVVDHGALGRSK